MSEVNQKSPLTDHWPQGLKRTPVRLKVAEMLEAADAPLCAADIYDRLQKMGEHANLSTVYRILDAFAEHGLAEKTLVSPDAPAYYEAFRAQHRHYAICVQCRKLIPLGHCPFDRRNLHLEEQGFEMIGHRLEIYGYCKECRAKDDNNKSNIF